GLQGFCGGNTPATPTLDESAFGIDLFPTLPEDEFDRQPLKAAGRFLLIADIRLDNRDDLVAELGVNGRGKSDSELLLAAWERWQDGCLSRLIGDFAFAVWDRQQKIMTLVRDPTGQRSLFYARERGRTTFASTRAALLTATE